MANGPEVFYNAFGADPGSGLVTDLQGSYRCSQDCDMWLRFRSSDRFVPFLLHRGFVPVACSLVSTRFVASSPLDRFVPSWEPVLTAPAECYSHEQRRPNSVWRVFVLRNTATRVTHTIVTTGPPV